MDIITVDIAPSGEPDLPEPVEMEVSPGAHPTATLEAAEVPELLVSQSPLGSPARSAGGATGQGTDSPDRVSVGHISTLTVILTLSTIANQRYIKV